MNKSNVFIVMLIVLIAIAGCSFIAWYIAKPSPVMLQGEAVAQSYKVSSKLVGRVDTLSVRIGDAVTKGEFLFSLSTPEVDAKLKQAEAMLAAADARDEIAKKGLRKEEVDAIFNMWQKAQAGLELAKVTYERVKNLYEEGVVPAQKLDEATANLKASQTTELAAHAQYLMAKDGARPEDKKAAAALVSQASGGVQEVESYLSDAYQYYPIDGEVSSVIAEKGELVNAGYPVVTLIDLNDMWLAFNIKETLLPKIKKDMVVNVYVPALDQTIKTKVTYIAVQAQYATWTATRSSGEFDIRTFEVRFTPIEKINGLRPGMSALFDWNKL